MTRLIACFATIANLVAQHVKRDAARSCTVIRSMLVYGLVWFPGGCIMFRMCKHNMNQRYRTTSATYFTCWKWQTANIHYHRSLIKRKCRLQNQIVIQNARRTHIIS